MLKRLRMTPVGARRVAVNMAQGFDLRFEQALDLRAIALDARDSRAETGKRNRDILGRVRQQGKSFALELDGERRRDDDRVDAPDFESFVHEFFAADRQKLDVLFGIEAEMTQRQSRADMIGAADRSHADDRAFQVLHRLVLVLGDKTKKTAP